MYYIAKLMGLWETRQSNSNNILSVLLVFLHFLQSLLSNNRPEIRAKTVFLGIYISHIHVSCSMLLCAVHGCGHSHGNYQVSLHLHCTVVLNKNTRVYVKFKLDLLSTPEQVAANMLLCLKCLPSICVWHGIYPIPIPMISKNSTTMIPRPHSLHLHQAADYKVLST